MKPLTSPSHGKTGLVYHDLFLEHDTGANHPESPDRLRMIVAHLKKKKLWDKLVPINPATAPLKWCETIHSAAYLERLKEGCRSNRLRYMDSPDTPVSKMSFATALLAAGGTLKAVDAVMDGKARNAFCAIRPPGHHALRDKAMGFCLLNNVAIAARYIQQFHGLPRVLIVDWDVHHGNGTQAAFYDDPAVLYFSVHRGAFYPGTGNADEVGEGRGKGFTINVPLARGAGDEEYLRAFNDVLKPAALRFKPDFILISAGFDAHEKDPLGGMLVSAGGYARMTEVVKAIAAACCHGRIVSVLEGGYSQEGLAESVEYHLKTLMD